MHAAALLALADREAVAHEIAVHIADVRPEIRAA
jgi:hypothetical protein